MHHPARSGRQNHDTLAEAYGLEQIMSDEHGGQAALSQQGQQQILQLPPQAHIECTEGLVQKQQVRLHGQSSGQRHPLTHAAAELMRIFFQIPGLQTKASGQIPGRVQPLAPALAQGFESESDVVQSAPPGQQPGFLKHTGRTVEIVVYGA